MNNVPGPGRYQGAQNYGPLTRRQQGPYAVDRGDGTVSRLIPADELPFDIVGVPRREAPGSFNVVSGQLAQGPPYQVVRMDRGRVTSPQTGSGLSRIDYQPPHPVRTNLQYDAVSLLSAPQILPWSNLSDDIQSGMSYNQAIGPALAQVYPTEALQVISSPISSVIIVLGKNFDLLSPVFTSSPLLQFPEQVFQGLLLSNLKQV